MQWLRYDIESHRGWWIDLSQEREARALTEESGEGQRPLHTMTSSPREAQKPLCQEWASMDTESSFILVPTFCRNILNPNFYWIHVQINLLGNCGLESLFSLLKKIPWDALSFSCRSSVLSNETSAFLLLPTNTSKLGIICIFHIRISSISWLNMMRWCWRTLLFYVSILRKMSLFNLTTSWQK